MLGLLEFKCLAGEDNISTVATIQQTKDQKEKTISESPDIYESSLDFGSCECYLPDDEKSF